MNAQRIRTASILLAVSVVTQLAAAGQAHAQRPGMIPEWLLWGPEPFTDASAPFAELPEAAILQAVPSEGTETTGHAWKRVDADASGQVDIIGQGLDQEELTSAFLHAYVWSPREQDLLLSVGSDDGIQVFVNGADIHTDWVLRGWAADQDRFDVRLGQGWNRLLLRVGNNTGGFAGSARFLAPDGSAPVPGLRYAADRPADYQAVHTAPRLLFESVRLGPTMARSEDGSWQLPLLVRVRNLGTERAEGAVLGMDLGSDDTGRGQAGVFFLAPVEAGTSDVRVLLPPDPILDAVLAGRPISARMRWGGTQSDPGRLRVRPEGLLTLLATGDPGDAMLRAGGRDIPGIIERWTWGERFRPDLFADGDTWWRNLLGAYRAGDAEKFGIYWDGVVQVVEEGTAAVRALQIDFIGNAHIDMAWLWQRPETIEVVDHTYAQALRFMDEFDDFKYAQSQMQTYAWADSLLPDVMAGIDAAVAAGRWIPVGGMWVEPDCNLPSGESFVRQILYGKGYIRDRYGIDIRLAWNPDSFGYAWSLPMIFQGAGIDYFITQKIGWNDTTTFPWRLFNWEAPDGSKVLTYFPFTYGDDIVPATLARRMQQQQVQQPGLTDMLDLYGVGDHGGGPTRGMIQRYNGMKELPTFPQVRQTSPEAFMERVEAKYPDVPTWETELYLEYHRGTLTTHADMKRQNRLMESRLEATEKFAAAAASTDMGYMYPKGALDDAWKKTLFNQFHDILPGSSIRGVYEDANADYAAARRLVEAASVGALEALSARVRTDRRPGRPVVVFNPLSWTRTGIVEISTGSAAGVLGTPHVLDASGREVPSQVTGEVLRFVAPAVPGVGYATFWVGDRGGRAALPGSEVSLQDLADRIVLQNEALTAVVDRRTGDLRSLRHRVSGREMLKAGEGGNVLQMFGDIPDQWDAWNIGYTGEEETLDSDVTVEVLSVGPMQAAVRVTRGPEAARFTHDYVVTAGMPWLDIRTEADWHESHRMVKAAFFVEADPETATFEIPYGHIDRTTHPETPAEKAKWEVPGQRWVDLTDRSGGFGLTLLNDSKYGYDVVGNRLRLTLLRSPKYPDPQADMGHHRMGYALYPHAGDWKQADAYRRGAEYNLPLEAVVADRGRGAGLASSGLLLSTDSEHVMLSVFKATRRVDHMPRYAVRIIETEGRSGPVSVTFPFDIAMAWEANLMEDLGAVLQADGRTVTIAVGPWQLKTIVADPSHDGAGER